MISRPLSGGYAAACTRPTWQVSIPGRERLAVSPTRKRIIILPGPNGAGKTTFAREFLPDEAECPTFVNADLIAAGLSPFNPGVVAMRAGRLMLELIEEHVTRGDSFAFETTLAGKSYARHIPRWQAAGYHVTYSFWRYRPRRLLCNAFASESRRAATRFPRRLLDGAFWLANSTSRLCTSRSSTHGRSTITRTPSRFC